MSDAAGPAPPPIPELVVTLPGRTPKELKRELAIAEAAGADLVEIRLDRMRREDIPGLASLHQIPITHPWVPAIATLRSRAEGGEGPDEAGTRKRVLEEALDVLPFTWVDLEAARDRALGEEFSTSFGRPLGVIASSHLPPETSAMALAKALHETIALGRVGKVVLPATVSRVLHELKPLCESVRGARYVVHTTGPSAPLLRLLAPELGMSLVYCGLPDGEPRVDAGQPPADRMRGVLDSHGTAPWYGILGHPVGHTRSPMIQHAFLQRSGLAGIYVPLDIQSPEEFESGVPWLLSLGFRGLNVTRPYKSAAFELADRQEESAVVCGAANTLVPREEGTVLALNTDMTALVEIFGELIHDGRWKDLRLLVAGAGGLARAAVAAGVEVGATVFVTARREAEVTRLVQEFPAEVVHPIPLASLGKVPLLFHATPAGQEMGGRLDLPLEDAMGEGTLVMDGVYLPATDYLQSRALTKGATYRDGWDLLVRQAALSFRAFTGIEVARSVVEEFQGNPPRPLAASPSVDPSP